MEDSFSRVAGAAAILGAFVAAAGVVLLVTMFALFAAGQRPLGLVFGMLNDISVAIQYLLTLPVAVALRRRLDAGGSGGMRAITTVGIVSMLLAAALSAALVADVIPFPIQAPLVSAAMLFGIGSWLWVVGQRGRATGRLPVSVTLTALAIFYVGLPVWLWRVGMQLRSDP